MYPPSPLLLFWCGLAATAAAAVAGNIIGGDGLASWPLAARARALPQAIAVTVAAGLIAYPLIYGLIFEALHRADVYTGALFGVFHALVAFAITRPRNTNRAALRAAIAHLAYAITIAFLYVTP